MSWNPNNHGLPFLPGYTFRDITKTEFHRPQTLEYRNGFALPRRPLVGIGQEPLLSEQLIQQEMSELSFARPGITYGSFDKSQAEEFVPAHVALDKKVLRFFAYFQEDVLYASQVENRLRNVVMYYFLEDDSISIFEPTVENSGIPQGKRLKRQRVPKNDSGDHYLWKDLNIGMDLDVYGVKYHITQCDSFTKIFLESEGILLNDPEPMPMVSHSKTPEKPVTPQTATDFDRMLQFLTMDRKVLRFFASWEDSDGECRPVTIHYYLVDNTVEIREDHQPNSGRDRFPVVLRRQRLPKRMKAASENFPRCVLELSPAEVDEYYSPRDFQVGQSLELLGRRFLLCNCDHFTKEYYQKNLPDITMQTLEVQKTADVLQDRKKEVPPYNYFGSLEDSLQNCLSLIPKPSKRNVQKMLENGNKVLRYTAQLDSPNPEDEGRHFILSYYLSNDMIGIYEKPTRNSGILGGKFLEKTRVPKPGCSVENPEFYSPADFAIGSTVEVFSHRFVLTDADHYVLKYLESISNEIPTETLESVRNKLGVTRPNTQPDEGTGDGESH
ncbi:EF-hand domain-containing protein 1-like [Synchiropus splendidus]|uniref:EF-hand domain-containing protein 1-like n=1 Tax=Synchiropus splendidus TaxID=270530 RepID=UPI00237E8B37|nr:EF-hand domain-containing protein 1-like [Synchiropus splendidus]